MSEGTTTERVSVRRIALAQQYLLWVVFASFLLHAVALLLGLPIATLIALPFQLHAMYRLARALEKSPAIAVIWLVFTVIPLVGLIIMLALNGEATRVLKQAGVRVGIMGVAPQDLPGD